MRIPRALGLAVIAAGLAPVGPSTTASIDAPVLAAASGPAPTVTVSSEARVSILVHNGPPTSKFCGTQPGDPRNIDCGEASTSPHNPFQPEPPSSQYMWGWASTSFNTCGREPSGPGCTKRGANGWGIDGVPATTVELGSPFPFALTWNWNALQIEGFPTFVIGTGSVHVVPPGLPPFDISLDDDDLGGMIRLINRVIDNDGPCPPETQRSNIPCDDVKIMGTSAELGVLTQVSNGVTWHLELLGLIDPNNPNPGEITSTLVLPEPAACAKDDRECAHAANANLQPVIAPLMARLTVDTTPTSTALATEDDSVPAGSAVRLSAAVLPAPTSGGTVAFLNGTEPIPGCTAQPVDSAGTASCETSELIAGTHTLSASYSGAIGFGASTSNPLTQVVERPRPTRLVYSGAATAQFSDPAGMRATLTADGGEELQGQPVVGRSVSFAVGTQSAGATTDASGLAATTINVNQPAASPGVSSVFAGDAAYLDSSDADAFTITPEDATVAYTGPSVAVTVNAPVELSAQVTEAADAYLGNRLAATQLRFTVRRSTTNAVAGTCTATVSPTGPGVGTGHCPLKLGIGLYRVTVELVANGYYAAAPAQSPKLLSVGI